MSGKWPLVRLGDVLIQRPVDVVARPECTYDFAGVKSFGRGVFRSVQKTGTEFSYKGLTRLRTGDLVYPKLMAWEGAIAIVPPECDGCVVSPEFPVFEARLDRVVPAFLEGFFHTGAGKQLLLESSSGTNVRRRRVQPATFLELAIPLPPLDEQRRVVARIEEVVGRVNETQALHHEIHSDAHQLLTAAFWQIAATAERRPMADVAPMVRRDVAVSVDNEYPEVGIRSFGKGTFHKPPLGGAQVGGKRIFRIEEGDLLFSNVFAWEGAVAVASARDSGRFGSHRFMSCVPRREVATPSFLRFYFLTGEGLATLGSASPGGAGRNRTLGVAALAAISVPVPIFEKQLWFDAVQAKVDALRRLQSATAAQLDALLPSILDRAFKGALL